MFRSRKHKRKIDHELALDVRVECFEESDKDEKSEEDMESGEMVQCEEEKECE